MTFLDYLYIYLRGLAMGAADIVPGVSGGTIAFITGIYQRFITALSQFSPQLLPQLYRREFKAVWIKIDGAFLITLFLGILSSFVLFSQLMKWLMAEQAILLWSFFSGLILASISMLFKEINNINKVKVSLFILGAGLALLIACLPSYDTQASFVILFFGAMLAITAMLLPGISGSFILLLLGLYDEFIEALANFDLVMLGAFGLGCICGILAFTRILAWCLKLFYENAMAFLTGVVVGSMFKLWPWKLTVSTRINSKGEAVPLLQENVLPYTYTDVTGLPHDVWGAVLCLLIGFAIVWGVNKVSAKS